MTDAVKDSADLEEQLATQCAVYTERARRALDGKESATLR